MRNSRAVQAWLCLEWEVWFLCLPLETQMECDIGSGSAHGNAACQAVLVDPRAPKPPLNLG